MRSKPEKQQPIYRRIKQYILENIDRGEWQVGARIPSEAELEEYFATSRMTVNRAVRELTVEGKLTRSQGRGTFVAAHKPRSTFLEISSIAEDIKSRGGEYSCKVHLLSDEKASPHLAVEMGVKPYSSVYHSIIIHYDSDIPIQLADRFVNPSIAPDYLMQDFESISPADYLLKVAPEYSAEHVVEAMIPDAWIRDLLDISESEPCLALSRKTWVKGDVATLSKLIYPGSRYSLGGRFATSEMP